MKLKCYFETYPGAEQNGMFFSSYPLTGTPSVGNKRYVAIIEVPDNDGLYIPVTAVTEEVKE